MKESIINRTARMLMLLMAVLALRTSAQESDVPKITMYYPGVNEESPMELKHNATAYVYFESGSHIVEAKAQVIQNDEVLGVCVYTPTMPGGTTAAMKPGLPENAVLDLIEPGIFTISIYEVTYTAGTENKTYSDTEHPIGRVTYLRRGANGKIVEETGFDDKMVLSYYAPDSDGGVKVFTFDKAVEPGALYVYYRYGTANVERTATLPFSLSDDGKKLTIDVRGHCYNVNTLAPGVTFKDDEGNPVAPPAFITMVVEGLKCTDGTRISSVATSLDGSSSYQIEGQIYRSYNYTDLTFPTPQLTKAEFYDQHNPAVMLPSITATVTHMNLYISGMEHISSCGVVFDAPGVSVSVPATDVTKGSGRITVAVPEEVMGADSGNLSISLTDVVYTTDDGTEHVIAPLRLSHEKNEVHGVAELKALPVGATTNLVVEDMKVTLSNDLGLTFAEDATGGLQIMTADGLPMYFHEGELISGTLFGVYYGYGMFVVKPERSDYTSSSCDISRGTTVDSYDTLVGGSYDNCLVSINNAESMNVLFDETVGAMLVNGEVLVSTDCIGDGYQWPAEIKNLTGVLYRDTTSDMYILILRSAEDVNRELTSIELPDIDGNVPAVIYDLRGIQQHSTDGLRGIHIVNGVKVLIK